MHFSQHILKGIVSLLDFKSSIRLRVDALSKKCAFIFEMRREEERRGEIAMKKCCIVISAPGHRLRLYLVPTTHYISGQLWHISHLISFNVKYIWCRYYKFFLYEFLWHLVSRPSLKRAFLFFYLLFCPT